MSPKTPDELKQLYTPQDVAVIKPEKQVLIVRFSACGRYLAAGGYDGAIRRWDVSQDERPELPLLAIHHGWIQAAAFHPQQPVLFSADSWGRICRTPIEGEQPQPQWSIEGHDGWITSLALSPDAARLATCARDGHIRIWSADDGKLIADLGVQTPPDLLSVAWHPDGQALVAGDLFGNILHFDLSQPAGKPARSLTAETLAKLHRLQDTGGVRALAFTPDKKQLLACGCQPSNGGTVQGKSTIVVYDWESGEIAKTLVIGENNDCFIYDLAFHDDFVMCVTSGTPGRGKLMFLALDQEKPFFETTKMPNCHSLTRHPDGRRFAVSATSTGSNGNGRPLNNGQYKTNHSPIHILTLPEPTAG